MPQPAVLDDIQQPLIDAYRLAWTRIQAEQEQLALNPLAYRRQARLTQMRKVVEEALAGLDDEAAKWVSQQLPKIYLAGAAPGSALATGAFDQIHQEAVQRLAGNLFEELLSATQHVKDSTKRLIREVAKDEALQKAIVGKTATEASREMRRVLKSKGIHAVVYSNGSKHGLAEYTQVAMRTTTAKAYNSGTLDSAQEVKYWEIFDGPNCGLSYHDDPTLALGLIVGRDEAEKYLISHPNCRRSFGARPDITRPSDKTTSTASQRTAQLEQDAARGDKEAIAELANPSGRDVFSKRQARLDEQKKRYAEADRAAALAKRVEKRAIRPPDPFPQFVKMTPETYDQALKAVNPGTGKSYRNNCHFVAPSMELRARGYDVVASQTFASEGRFTHSIAQDWVDPATGQPRKFQGIATVGKGPDGLARELSSIDIDNRVQMAAQDWPPGARGFITCSWKSGGGHIWNVYKEDNGTLRYVDGQVKASNVRSYLKDVKQLQVMRVDDLQPVADRLSLVATKQLEAVDRANQTRVAFDLFAQMAKDAGTSGFAFGSYQQALYDLESKLKLLGIKEPWVELKKRQAPSPV